MKDIFKFSEQPKFENASLVVGWRADAGNLGPKVIEYLSRKIKAKSFCEIEPADFFPFGGVAIENDAAQFPECRFYYGEMNDVLVFMGSEPQFERYKFLNAVLDLAEHYCSTRELYTVNGTISPIAHTSPRRILAVFNQQEFQSKLRDLGLEDMNWRGPPAISSYLLWIAKRRDIPGVSLWTEVPFYLAACDDFQAIKTTFSFLATKFELGSAFGELDDQIKQQNAKMAQLREEEPTINKYIGMLESGVSLGGDEQMELTREATKFLEKGDL